MSNLLLVALCTIPILVTQYVLWTNLRQATGDRSYMVCFVAGLIFIPAMRLLVSKISLAAKNSGNKDAAIGEIYGLDHGRLNVEMPPKSMWMNMGYWRDTNDFPTACRALLIQVLRIANVMGSVLNEGESYPVVHLIDLGFGCGDQIEFLMRQEKPGGRIYHLDEWYQTIGHESPEFPVFRSYVGVTLSKAQFYYAKARLDHLGLLIGETYGDVQIFCADAANPHSWPAEIHQATMARKYPPDTFEHSPRRGIELEKGHLLHRNVWVLALDTFYHFSPSRWPVIEHAHSSQNASIMAFDLVLSENATMSQKALLFIVCSLSGSPYRNFVTAKEYRARLQDAGYRDPDIVIKDISEHVFAPLTGFLNGREKDLDTIGVGLGGLKAAKWLFGWWARTGVVRGVIVVARHETNTI